MPHKNRPRPLAGCPPPAGVMVVIGDPPSGRGQPATSRQTEETHQDKIQLRNRPLKRVNPRQRVNVRKATGSRLTAVVTRVSAKAEIRPTLACRSVLLGYKKRSGPALSRRCSRKRRHAFTESLSSIDISISCLHNGYDTLNDVLRTARRLQLSAID